MENPSGEPEEILLENLEKEYYRLNFLVDIGDENIKKEMEISIQAGRLVGVLYEEILKQYHDPTSEYTLKSPEQAVRSAGILPVCGGCGYFRSAFDVSPTTSATFSRRMCDAR